MNKLMCHVVAGYPDRETCLELIQGMSDLDVAAIEVQIPFSDPIADGETIMRANDTALEGGMTTAGSFDLIEVARHQGVKADVYIMSYIQKVQHFGLSAFCEAAAKVQARGLIVPDLPYDSPEYEQLAQLTEESKLKLVPVLSPGMPKNRLHALLASKPAVVYVTSQRGITGNAYQGGQELEQFIAGIKVQAGPEVMIGFGISTPEDVADALKLGDIAVIGSAIIKKLQNTNPKKTLDYIAELTGTE